MTVPESSPSPIKIFGIDTTSRYASLSLAYGEEIVAEYNFKSQDSLSSTMVPAVEWLLKNAGITIEDIDFFGITAGPGLFTGIRVGMATLKGLLLGKETIAIVPVSTLEVLAYKLTNHVPDTMDVVPIIDAGRNEVYLARYNHRLEEIVAPVLVNINNLKETLAITGEAQTQGLCFTGSGVTVHRSHLDALPVPVEIRIRSPFLAAEICRLAFREFNKGNVISNLQELMPVYIRKPDAEQNLRSAARKSG